VITDVVIEDYQAVREARIRLGRVTVITGPTGSGKSAVIRAIRLATFNARGTSFIRHGVKKCKVALGFQGELRVVGIERGGRGADKYRLVTMDMSPYQSTDKPVVTEFTKLAGAVPSQVSEALKLSELNFAGQFERPFLLDASGGQVARTLGELTNVTLVLDAAREATRRKLETARELKRAEAELESLKVQAAAFRRLRERREAMAEAQERMVSVTAITEQLTRMRKLAEMHRQAAGAVHRAQSHLEALDVPSLDQLDRKVSMVARLVSFRETLSTQHTEHGKCLIRADQATREEEAAHQELHDLLTGAGVCPTCGQAVSGT
jgi:DNA repair protein SbcC/Rad50